MDLGFVLRDPATDTYYFVGYVTVGNVPVGSVVSQGWNPAEPDVWQDQGPSQGSQLVLTEVTASNPPGNPFVNNTSLGPRFSSSDFRPFSNDVALSASSSGIIDAPSEVICFCAGTLILTATGERAVETLAVGDLVATRDHGLQPLRWLGSVAIGAGALKRRPGLVPLRIAAGALGPGRPHSALMVSPQHRILLRSRIVAKVTGAPEALAAARHLIHPGGIEPAPQPEGVTYLHLLFDRHEIVLANGAEAESLFLGPEAQKARGGAPLPALPADLRQDAEPARMLLAGRAARKITLRHLKNGVPLNAGDAPPARRPAAPGLRVRARPPARAAAASRQAPPARVSRIGPIPEKPGSGSDSRAFPSAPNQRL
ncbi:MAG: Hint domain-containing protein [Defluviimonas sp.]|nr:Hint domain-containing protein [Defluviimonas sp.]